MSQSPLELAMLSDLNVAVDPQAWAKERARRRLLSLHQTVSAIENGFLNNVIVISSNALRTRVYRKLVTSLNAFRRSFSVGFQHSEEVISLAIAFETLLTDFYAPGVTERISRRVRLCLKGVNGTRRLQAATTDLFACRGAIVHQGTATKLDNIQVARQAYILCLQYVVSQLSRLPREASDPIAQILGD